MEALTAVSVGLLTIYDMCKAVDKNMEIGRVKLIEKAKNRYIRLIWKQIKILSVNTSEKKGTIKQPVNQ